MRNGIDPHLPRRHVVGFVSMFDKLQRYYQSCTRWGAGRTRKISWFRIATIYILIFWANYASETLLRHFKDMEHDDSFSHERCRKTSVVHVEMSLNNDRP